MKRIMLLFEIMIFAVVMLTGCGGKDILEDENKLSIVTTIFPEYDWIREITKGNDNVEITMLLNKGTDLHSFQPTTEDIVEISSCDMFVYVGGESDEWVDDALEDALNGDMVTVKLLDVLGDFVKEEEIVEGMQGEEEGEDEEEIEYDEHVWLSLKNAMLFCRSISDELCTLDPENKALYETNANAYVSKLGALDNDYEMTVNSAATRTVLFGDRFPFRYMVDDYGLDYYAAFVGCSAESEAGFGTIKFLADKTEELGLNAVLQIESSDGKIANTIVETTSNKNQEIFTLDSMQSVTFKDIENGATYFGIMESNLEVLKKALN